MCLSEITMLLKFEKYLLTLRRQQGLNGIFWILVQLLYDKEFSLFANECCQLKVEFGCLYTNMQQLWWNKTHSRTLSYLWQPELNEFSSTYKKPPQQARVNIISYWFMKVPDDEKWLIYFCHETHLLGLLFINRAIVYLNNVSQISLIFTSFFPIIFAFITRSSQLFHYFLYCIWE